jgi:hypothetical protein
MKKKNLLRVISLVIVLTMIMTTAAYAMPPGHFKQLVRYDFDFNEAADFMKGNGIMKGYGNGDFGFNDYVKRGDIAVMVERAFKLSAMLDKLDIEDFEDVNFDQYFYYAVVVERSLGIAKGDGKKFNPNKFVTIEEAIALIERSAAVANKNAGLETDDLSGLYDEDEMDDFAKREDIAAMLYYVLTGEDEYERREDETADGIVVYEIDENDTVEFGAEKFIEAFDELSEEDLDYIEFTLPIKHGKIYYDYDGDKIPVDEDTKYYVNDDNEKEIDNLTFVPTEGYYGTVFIRFTATGGEESYTGWIKIIIGNTDEEEEGDEELADIKYVTAENTAKKFNDTQFINVFDVVTDEDFDHIVFTSLPDSAEGTLYFDDDKDGDLEEDEDIDSVNDDEFEQIDIDNLVFMPEDEFTGKVELGYKAFEEDGGSYEGTIIITVKEDYQIDKIELKTDENRDLAFDFEDELGDVDELEGTDVFDTVKFTELPDADEGILYLSGTIEDSNKVVLNHVYNVEDLNNMVFVPAHDVDNTVVVSSFTAYDDTTPYEGTIKITIRSISD